LQVAAAKAHLSDFTLVHFKSGPQIEAVLLHWKKSF